MKTVMNKLTLNFRQMPAALLGLLLLAGCAAPLSAAETKGDMRKGQGGPGTPAVEAQQGPEVVNQGRRYVLLQGVRAVKSGGQADDPAYRLAELGVAAESVVASRGGMIVYRARGLRGEAVRGFALRREASGQHSYPVVRNKETGMLGIVLGTLQVKLSDTAKAHALAKRHGLTVVRVHHNIGWATYQADDGQDPFTVARALAAEPGVESARAEILEHINVPH